ncbi:MAG TPA: hypothetical protein VFO05_10735 [Candidatus Limnocylindrales bacterium]|nr:hypothetical protein [Candidatus Limnocylindrales bacterium]
MASRVDAAGNSEQVLSRTVDRPLAKLDLERRPRSVTPLDDGVSFESRVLPVVVNRCVQSLGINPKISNNERLEQETQRLRIPEEPLGRRVERRDRKGRVDELSRGSLAQAGAGPQGGCPGRQILDDEQSGESRRVLDHRVIVDGAIRPADVGGERTSGSSRGDVPRQRPKDPADVRRITPDSVKAEQVNATRLVEVAPQCDLRVGGRATDQCRPTADGDSVSEIPNSQARVRGPRVTALEERSERHVARRVTGLRE